jgi:hypothetical protein
MFSSNDKAFIRRATMIFVSSFIIFYVPTYMIYSLFGSTEAAWLVSLIISGVFALFSATNIAREMSEMSFEINSSNKDPQKGLSLYVEETKNLLLRLRFEIEKEASEEIIFRPKGLLQVMNGKIYIKITPYFIVITGPKGIVKILLSSLDLTKHIL